MTDIHFYGHTRRCLVKNNQQVNSEKENIETLKQKLEFQVWYKLNKKISKEQQKQNQNGKKYLDPFFVYLPKNLNKNNILIIAKIIDLLEGNKTDYPDIEYIAPLFVSNPLIFIKYLNFYHNIRRKLTNLTNNKLDNLKKSDKSHIYELFFKPLNISETDADNDKACRNYIIYKKNKEIFPNLKLYDYYSKVNSKTDFMNLCKKEKYECKKYEYIDNQYFKKTEENYVNDPTIEKFFKLEKLIGFENYKIVNSNIINIYRNQLIDDNKEITNLQLINNITCKRIQIKNQTSNINIKIKGKLEDEIINYIKVNVGNKEEIKQKIKTRIKNLEATDENKYELNNPVIWTEYYKYNVFFLYQIDETEKNKIKKLFNFGKNLTEQEKNFCFYYFENKIFQEIAFEIGQKKNKYNIIGNELKNAVINNSKYNDNYINPYNDNVVNIKDNLTDALAEIRGDPPNFNWKYNNSITKEKINDFNRATRDEKKLLKNQMDKYGRFNNKNEDFKNKTLEKFYSKNYFVDPKNKNNQEKFFTFENTSETKWKVNNFIKSFIGYDDKIKNSDDEYDINKLTHKLITKLDQVLDTVNIDLNVQNYSNIEDKNIFLANGNLGGNDEKLKWIINADNNKKYIIFLQEVLFKSNDNSKEASMWIDEYDYLKSKDSNNNTLSYVNNTEISEDNLLQIRLDKNENIHHGCGILYNETKFAFVKRINPSYKKIQLRKNKSISNRSTDWIILKVKDGPDEDKHIAVLSVHLQVVSSFFTFNNNLLILQSIKKDEKEFKKKNIPCIIGGDFQNMIYKNYQGDNEKLDIENILTNNDFTKISPSDNSIDYIFCSKNLLQESISNIKNNVAGHHNIFTFSLDNSEIEFNIIENNNNDGILNFFEPSGQLMNTFSNNSFGSTFSIPLQYKRFRNTIINEIITNSIEDIEIKKISDNEYGFTTFSYYQRINDNKIENKLSSLINTIERKTNAEGILELSDLKNINLIDFIKKNKVLKLKVDY